MNENFNTIIQATDADRCACFRATSLYRQRIPKHRRLGAALEYSYGRLTHAQLNTYVIKYPI